MKAKLLRIAFVAVILASLVSLLPISVYAQTTIRNIGNADGFVLAQQEKTVYVAGRQWAFFEEAGTGYFSSSADNGATWNAPTSIGASAHGYELAIATDGTNIAYIRGVTATTTLYFRMGTANADGTIAWLAAEQTVFAATYFAAYCTVAFDSNGYPWIGTTTNADAHAQSFKSSTKDGTWTTEAGFPKEVSNTAVYLSTTLLPATSGKMIALCARNTGAKLYAARYDGANWGATQTTASNLEDHYDYSATIQDDDAKIAFLEDVTYDIIYVEFDYSTNSFTAETTLVSGATSTSAPAISRDTTNNDLWVFWLDSPTANHVYLRLYDSSITTWSAVQDVLLDSDGLPANNYYINSDLASPRDNLGIYYVANPTLLKYKHLADQFVVSTLTPSGVTDTEATLRGSIDSIAWGNPTERGFYLNTSASFVGAAHFSESGIFGTGVFNRTIGSLAASTTYYYVAYATNAETAWGSWGNFTTLGEGGGGEEPGGNCTVAPSITTKAATYISITSAKLNALVNNAGCFDCTCSVYFQWYKTGGAWGDNQNLSVSGYHTGDTPYLNIYSLEGNTTYYYRAIASNNCGNTTGNTISFTTLTTLENVTDFLAIPEANQAIIDLKWQKPTGATTVMVRYKLGEYPGNTTDGTLVVQTSMNTYSHEDLTPGDTLYYSAWGISGNVTSTTAIHAIATVSLIRTHDVPTAPGQPSNWFLGVQYTNMSGMPFYSVINTVADAFGFNRQFFWGSLGFMIALLVFIGAYRATQGRTMVSLIATTVVMGVETKMGLMAGFMIFILLLLSITSWEMERRG